MIYKPMPHLLFFHKNFPGACHVGLGVTAGNSAKVLEKAGLATADTISVQSPRDVMKSISEIRNTTHVVLHAPWMPAAEVENIVRTFPRIQFAVICHSNVAFLQVDPGAVENCIGHMHLERTVANFHLAGNSRKFCNAVMRAYGGECLYLPNLYPLLGPPAKRPLWNHGTLRIGAFGATRGLKNLMTAAWASLIIANVMRADTELWVSGGREEGGAGIIPAIHKIINGSRNVKLVVSPWQKWAAFRETVKHMHLLLQPSFTESFNVVTADGCAEGVPCVVSDAIDWAPENWKAKADCAVSIADTGVRLIADKRAPAKGYAALVRHNEDGILAWADFLR